MSGSCTADYADVIVKKPWGYEYLMYQNDRLGLWYLHIRHGARTSLHCHPRKKTGLLLLAGEVTVSFLNDSTPLKAPARLMIRPGLFHSTSAVSPEGAVVLEVETPRDKDNLVRLEDPYGRKEQPYEGPAAQTPLAADCVRLAPPRVDCDETCRLHGCLLTLKKRMDVQRLRSELHDEIILVLDGGLYSRDGEPILAEGDIVSPATLNRLAETFAAPRGISLLTIRKA